MRVFTTLCKDNKTGYQMILSECSYNEACAWLYTKLSEQGWEVIKSEIYNGILTVIYTGKKHEGNTVTGAFTVYYSPTRRFFYDEERGYLLGE